MHASGEPHIFTLSAVTWDFPLVGRSRMLTEAWLSSGRRTTFVQVPSLRTGVQKVLQRHRDGIVERPWPGLPARSWPMVGDRGYRLGIRASAALLAARLRTRYDLERSVALVVSPIWAPWLEHLPFARVLYDCIDDPDIHAPRADSVEFIRRWERELIDRSDGVVVTASGLEEQVRRVRSDAVVETIRNGVDAERFRDVAASVPRPTDLPASSDGRPIVGFVGALFEWIDWDLIYRVAAALPAFRFVFVGPYPPNSEGQKLVARLSNTTFLGARPYAVVPSYMAGFDVAWVPFDSSRVSALANPIKIYEYLSLGLPVVTTPVADAAALSVVCRVADGAEAVAEAVRVSVGDTGDEAESARRAFADQHTWAARAEDVVAFARRVLG